MGIKLTAKNSFQQKYQIHSCNCVQLMQPLYTHLTQPLRLLWRGLKGSLTKEYTKYQISNTKYTTFTTHCNISERGQSHPRSTTGPRCPTTEERKHFNNLEQQDSAPYILLWPLRCWMVLRFLFCPTQR